MTKPMTMTVAVLAGAALLSSCSKKADTPPATTTTTTITTTAPAPVTAVASTGLPADCDAYFAKVEACAAKMGAAGAQYKQAMDASRTQWANMPNKEQVGPMCKQALAAFTQQSSMMGCS